MPIARQHLQHRHFALATLLALALTCSRPALSWASSSESSTAIASISARTVSSFVKFHMNTTSTTAFISNPAASECNDSSFFLLSVCSVRIYVSFVPSESPRSLSLAHLSCTKDTRIPICGMDDQRACAESIASFAGWPHSVSAYLDDQRGMICLLYAPNAESSRSQFTLMLYLPFWGGVQILVPPSTISDVFQRTPEPRCWSTIGSSYHSKNFTYSLRLRYILRAPCHPAFRRSRSSIKKPSALTTELGTRVSDFSTVRVNEREFNSDPLRVACVFFHISFPFFEFFHFYSSFQCPSSLFLSREQTPT